MTPYLIPDTHYPLPTTSIETHLQQALLALYQIADGEVLLQPTKKDFEGFYTFVTFGLSKSLRKSPVQIGQELGEYLVAHAPEVSGFNVVQGFLNLSVADRTWVASLNTIVADAHFGTKPANGHSAMVEFSSPNTNKPLHLGHLRNIFLGDSISRILKADGNGVVKTCLVNDRGVHICKSMLAYQYLGNGETPQSAGIKGDHLIGKYYVLFDREYKRQIEELTAAGMPEDEAKKQAPWMQEAQQMLQKWEQNDPATRTLWQQMNEWVYAGFGETYQKIGVSFDKVYYESQTYLLGKDLVADGLAAGVFFQKPDGSVWIDLNDEGLDQKLVLRADGTSVYMTQDLGTTDLKFSDYANDRSIWVVGNEQDYHFSVLFKIMKRLGRAYADGCYHLSYGMVDLPTGKMKSREGTVVDADELMAEVTAAAQTEGNAKGKLDDFPADEKEKLFVMLGLGALKYYLLKVDPQKRMLFNPAESVELHGNTGPFVQYTHARIRSVLRKAHAMGVVAGAVPADAPLQGSERELIFLLTEYPNRVADAARNYSPAFVAQFVYDLAKAYNSFYAEVSILGENDPVKLGARVSLSNAVGQTLQKALALLGIEAPERM